MGVMPQKIAELDVSRAIRLYEKLTMSLLVPDYASSSEDEVCPSSSVPTPPSAATHPTHYSSKLSSVVPSTIARAAQTEQKKTKKRRKTKTTLYLPPEIQRLLETGNGLYSDESERETDNGLLLGKHKVAQKVASKGPRPSAVDKASVLSFLPPPKHELPASDVVNCSDVAMDQSSNEAKRARTTKAGAGHQAVDEEVVADNAAAWPQYDGHQPQYRRSNAAGALDYSAVAHGEEDVPGGSSKRKRTRERDIERALQQGHFETVADQITDVQGPAPTAWEPPKHLVDGSHGSRNQEVQVKASFWHAQAGTKVSLIKPTRMQRQKHQLNQLAFDAKARNFELLEKRGAALKTKRETYAKYGW